MGIVDHCSEVISHSSEMVESGDIDTFTTTVTDHLVDDVLKSVVGDRFQSHEGNVETSPTNSDVTLTWSTLRMDVLW